MHDQPRVAALRNLTSALERRRRIVQPRHGRGKIEVPSKLLVPDTLIPAQYFSTVERRGYMTPEKKLMWAVLESAIHDLKTYHHATKPSEKRLFRETWDWFTGRENTGIFSFEVVCHAVDLDTDFVRRVLSRWLVLKEDTQQDTDGTSASYALPSGRKRIHLRT